MNAQRTVDVARARLTVAEFELDPPQTANDRRRLLDAKDVLLRHRYTVQRSPAPKVHRPQTIADLRREFGDERRNPALWDTLPDPLQRHWAWAKQRAGERLSEVERRAYNQPGVERRVTHNADLKVVTR